MGHAGSFSPAYNPISRSLQVVQAALTCCSAEQSPGVRAPIPHDSVSSDAQAAEKGLM